MSNIVRINQGRVLPWQFRLAGTTLIFVLIFGAFLKLPEMYAISSAILFSMLLPLLWSTYYLLEIDPENRVIKDGMWIVGYKKVDMTSYNSLEKIFINKVLVGQNISSYTGHVHHYQSVEYTAFLKLDNDKKFELLSDKSADQLKKKLKPIIRKLNCPVIENFDR